MKRMWKLLSLHAALEASLSEGKCSSISCRPRIQGQRLSVNMGLPPHTPGLGDCRAVWRQSVPAAPKWRNAAICCSRTPPFLARLIRQKPCQSCTRSYTRLMGQRNLSVLHMALIVSLSASKCSPVFRTRMTGQRSLSIPPAPLIVGQSGSKCWHSLCPPHNPSSLTIPL